MTNCTSGCPTQDCEYRCPSCGESRSCSEWYFRKSGKDAGKRVWPCKPCSNAKRVEWNRENPERAAQALRDWRAKNPRAALDIKLRSSRGISLEEYADLLQAQGGRCAICRSSDAGTAGGMFVVDHDHACCPTKNRSCASCIRGLLCTRCNVGIGMLGDDPDVMERAAEYVRRSN